jgi:transketolase
MSDHRSETTLGEDFDPKSWDMVGSLELSRQLISGEVLSEIADEREDVCVLTADLGRPTQVHSFKARHPTRYFNFGIAERNMVSAAAGFAAVGMRPYVSGYGFFLGMIAAEQIRTDICYPKLPVRMLGSHSGISMGFYGTSHHATEDIGILRSMADLTLLAPIDAVSLWCAIEATVDHPGPIYFRLGRGREAPVYERPPKDWRIGGSAELRAGEDAAILATGNCVNAALGAAERLAGEGIGVRIVDMYSLKPLDKAAVERAAGETRRIFTVEEHNVLGGLGSAVAEVLAESGSSTPLARAGIPDEYSLLGPPTHLYGHYRIDAEGIASAVQRSLHGEPPQSREGG